MSTKPTVLITGCSAGGLGDAFARHFAGSGYHVLATLRNPAKVSPELEALPSVQVYALDVASTESVQRLQKELASKLPDGKLDVLVNNAGLGAAGPLLEVGIEEVRKVYECNVFGLLAVTQACKEQLIRARGVVVNVSSVGGLLAMPWGGVYHSSKAAVTLLSETLRLELAPLGVRVITSMLGHVQSNFHTADAATFPGLAEDSPYKGVEGKVEAVAAGTVGPKPGDVEELAQTFVSDIVAGKTGQLWRGRMSTICGWLGYHAPWRALDAIFVSGSGLDEMAEEARGKRGKDD